MASGPRGSEALWYCVECRQMGRGPTFMNAHTIHGQLEELVFTGVTSSDPPANLDDLLKELENAKTNPELIVPDLDLVIQYLKRLETFSLLHITETTEVPTHSLVEALYPRGCTARGRTISAAGPAA